MILTKDKYEVVYIGRHNSEILYVGRGHISRPASLICTGHHIDYDFDEVEILGPYTHEESMVLEQSLIEEHTPIFNKKMNPKYSLRAEVRARARDKRIERDERIYQKETAKEMILERIKAGDKMAQIARDFGVSRQRIHQIKNKIFEKG